MNYQLRRIRRRSHKSIERSSSPRQPASIEQSPETVSNVVQVDAGSVTANVNIGNTQLKFENEVDLELLERGTVIKRIQTGNRNIPSRDPVSPPSEVIIPSTDMVQQYLRTKRQVTWGVEYFSPVSFEDVPPEDMKKISSIPWFNLQTIVVDAGNDFRALEH